MTTYSKKRVALIYLAVLALAVAAITIKSYLAG